MRWPHATTAELTWHDRRESEEEHGGVGGVTSQDAHGGMGREDVRKEATVQQEEMIRKGCADERRNPSQAMEASAALEMGVETRSSPPTI